MSGYEVIVEDLDRESIAAGDLGGLVVTLVDTDEEARRIAAAKQHTEALLGNDAYRAHFIIGEVINAESELSGHAVIMVSPVQRRIRVEEA